MSAGTATSTTHRFLVHAAHRAALEGRYEEARRSAIEAAAGTCSAQDLLSAASVLARCNEHALALSAYERCAALEPSCAEAHRGAALVHRFLGNVDAAERACDRTLELNAYDPEIMHLRSSLRTQRRDANHIGQLEQCLDRAANDWRGTVQLCYALGKEFEDTGEYKRAFAYYKRGADLRRQNLHYDLDDDLRIFPALEAAFDEASFGERRARNRGCDSGRPIFIVGLPRSGSTLVERIASAHPQVRSIGESDDFARQLLALIAGGHEKKLPHRLDLPRAALAVSFSELGRAYVEATSRGLPLSVRIIDKLPANSLYLGLIHLALPRAKIIHVRRDPMDACFAMYKFLFRAGYPFSYDLNELADYYASHARLMRHWRQLLPSVSLHEIDYEELVKHPEGAAHGLMSFLDLEWDPKCLDFHKQKSPSMTGSATQVRQPIYQSSVAAWRHYERELEPLALRLVRNGIARNVAIPGDRVPCYNTGA